MIRTLIAAAVLAAMPAAASAQVQPIETCGIFRIENAERVSYVPVPGFSILLGQPPFRVPQRASAVVCDRTSIFIGPNDHRVITDAGVPLFIRNAQRVAVLEIADRQLRLRFTEGEPTTAEHAAIGPAIERALAEMDRLPLRAPPQP